MAALISVFEALSVKARDGFTALCEVYGELDDGERVDLASFVAALRVGLPQAFRLKVLQAVRLQASRNYAKR